MQFRGGTYHLPATERLTAADSGSPSLKITYAAFPGESPMISGGVRLQNRTNISGNTWKTTLPPSPAYFEDLFYNGVRRLRPRLGGYLGTYYRVAAPVYVNAQGPPAAAPDANCEDYVSGRSQSGGPDEPGSQTASRSGHVSREAVQPGYRLLNSQKSTAALLPLTQEMLTDAVAPGLRCRKSRIIWCSTPRPSSRSTFQLRINILCVYLCRGDNPDYKFRRLTLLHPGAQSDGLTGYHEHGPFLVMDSSRLLS